MEWGTLAGIVLGAILGSGSTLAVDWIQARRNIDQQWLEARRQVYARFLVASAQAHSRMAVAAFNGLPGEERRQAVHEAFHSDPQNCDAKSVTRELAITAPHEVFQPALDVYNVLRDLRDVLAHSSFAADSPKYRARPRTVLHPTRGPAGRHAGGPVADRAPPPTVRAAAPAGRARG
jgi:hypothetical protein